MRKTIIMMAIMALAVPTIAQATNILEPIPEELIGKLNITDIEISYIDAIKPAIAAFDRRAGASGDEKPVPAEKVALAANGNDYALLSTTNMLSQMIRSASRDWRVGGDKDVRLRIGIETIKLAKKSNVALGKPNRVLGKTVTRLLNIFGGDDTAEVDGSYTVSDEEEIAGFVDVYTVKDDRRVGSFYIDILRRYTGGVGIPLTRLATREELGRRFSQNVAACLATAFCDLGKGK